MALSPDKKVLVWEDRTIQESCWFY